MDLLIKSLEGNTYLAEQRDGSSSHLVLDKHNRPLRFQSITSVREHFSDHSFEQVWLEHQSAYDEMCGMQAPAEPLLMPLRWK
ncbi:DUF6482 family protein [Thalassotalea montiporae]